jgi:hypothetical protein
MKISLLLKREPFTKILEETLSAFLSEYYGAHYTVKWFTKYQRRNIVSNSTGQRWLCNPLINSIYVEGAKDVPFDTIKHEYAINPIKPWRSLSQKLYIYLATKTKLGSVLAPYFLSISPGINNSSQMLIIGGNNKIRIIDGISKTVFVVLKRGFDKKYLEREIEIRRNFSYLPILPVIREGKTQWYSEKMIYGISPDRLSNDLGNQVLIDTSHKIHRLLTDTVQEEELRIYTSRTVSRISAKLENIKQICARKKRNILQATQTLVNELEKDANFKTDTIYTARTHGDFQAGNILYDGEKAWILDWEFSRRRQIGNDVFVLILISRNPTGFGRRFLDLLNNTPEGINKQLLNNWPFLNWENHNARRISLIVYLLEEIDFLLGENENPLFFGETLGLSPFMNELKQILRILT